MSAWQDDKSWTQQNAEFDHREEQNRKDKENDKSTNIPLYSNTGWSVLGFLKKLFSRKK